MIKVGASIAMKKVTKNLHAIQTKDIPAAEFSAYKWAGKRAATKASKQLASSLNVPKWMVAGFKGKGSRFRLLKYNRKMAGGYLYVGVKGLNPAGTKHKQAKVTTTKRGVRASRRIYKDAFAHKYKYTNAIYERDGSGLGLQSIELTDAHVAQIKRNVRRIFLPAYKRRFDHEFNRRLKRRGAR